MILVVSSFTIFFLIASILSGINLRSHCFLRIAFESIFRVFSINSLSISGISAGFYANMSQLVLRKLMRMLSYLSPSYMQIRVAMDESPSCNWMIFTPTSPMGFTLD